MDDFDGQHRGWKIHRRDEGGRRGREWKQARAGGHWDDRWWAALRVDGRDVGAGESTVRAGKFVVEEEYFVLHEGGRGDLPRLGVHRKWWPHPGAADIHGRTRVEEGERAVLGFQWNGRA